uniref:Uncharacterized protein n=1 Tax=Octopus bimaculoides TaxID=37653 RepID=A0A0L8GLR2_OCTBM
MFCFFSFLFKDPNSSIVICHFIIYMDPLSMLLAFVYLVFGFVGDFSFIPFRI